ncbi:MAG: STAS domain-containing protein [Planctomycetales bacterium]|nr:STAS domain-containing protein [Planctomycetales bacterium]
MPPARSDVLKAVRTDDGLLINVHGRATMRESWVIKEFLAAYLETDRHTIVVDLSRCEYLDSTFAGCLVELHKCAHADNAGSFALIANPQRRKHLLGAMRLDPLFQYVDTAPEAAGEPVALPGFDDDKLELVRHVLACHRELAEIEGPEQAAFQQLVARLEEDLDAQSTR